MPSSGRPVQAISSRAGFTQYKTPGLKRKITSAALHQDFVAYAPFLFACCADSAIMYHYGSRGTDLHCIQDVP